MTSDFYSSESSFISADRKLIDFRSVDGKYPVWFYQERFTNKLGVDDHRKLFLIERNNWERPEQWNYNELGKYKRAPGLLIPVGLYNRLIVPSTWGVTGISAKMAKLVVYIKRERKYYAASLFDLEEFVRREGIIFLDDVSKERVVGFAKSAFDALPV